MKKKDIIYAFPKERFGTGSPYPGNLKAVLLEMNDEIERLKKKVKE